MSRLVSLALAALGAAACAAEPAAFELTPLDPEDYRGPAVGAVDPAAGSYGVPVDYPVRVTFTAAVREASVLGAVSASGGDAHFPFRAALSGDRRTLTLTADWPPARVVRIRVGAGLVDDRGVGLRDQDPHDERPDTPFVLAVTTGVDRLADRPRVVSAAPAEGERHVLAAAEPRARFSKAMTEAAATLASAAGFVPGRTRWEKGKTELVFAPDAPLAPGRTYVFTVEAGRDAWGLPLAGAAAFRFATAEAAGHVVINEAVTRPLQDWGDSAGGNGVPFDGVPGDGDVTTSDEYVELYNAGASVVDLAGYTLEMLDGTAQTHLVGGAPAAVERYVGAAGDLRRFRPGDYLVIGNPVGDMGDAAVLVLRDAAGFEVDRVALAGDLSQEAAARLPNGKDTDADSDWGPAPATPGAAN